MNATQLITVVTPTADRPEWLKRAIICHRSQSHNPKEMLILDDGREPCKEIIPISAGIHYWFSSRKMTIGEKLNWLCERANGETIIRFDDDDWSSPYRIASQLIDLDEHCAGLVGYDTYYYYDTHAREAFQYCHPRPRRYAGGPTQCFRKSFWRDNPFPTKNIGEDTEFSNAARVQGKLWSCAGGDMLVARVHGKNVSCQAYWLRRRNCFSPASIYDLPAEFRAQEL
jgi:hypothetical protein